MAILDIHHALEIMKTAFPYMDSRTSETIELFIKAGDFYECLVNHRYKVNTMTNSDHWEEESDKDDKTDLVSMLKKLRSVCYENELYIIDLMLNIMNAMDIYESYTNLFSMISSEDNFNGFSNLLGFDGDLDKEDLIELLSSMLSPEDKKSMEELSMILKMMSTTNETGCENKATDENAEHNL